MSDQKFDTPREASEQAPLAAMRRRYVEASRDAVREFAQIGEQLAAAPDSPDLLKSLAGGLHRVRGTAGSLDFREAGRIAGALEQLAKRWSGDAALDREQRSEIVLNFSRALGSAIVDDSDAPASDLQRILLIGLPAAVGERLVAGATHLGFAVEQMDEDEYLARPGTPLPALLVTTPESAESSARVNPATPVLVLGPGGPPTATIQRGSEAMDIATDPRVILEWIKERVGRSSGGDSVIVLDDDPQMLMLLRILIEREGLSAHTASTEPDFRRLLDRAPPALAILDVEMPGVDGIDLLRDLRGSAEWRALPVLILSGRSDAETHERALNAGANGYLVKPVNAIEFQTRLRRLLRMGRSV